MLRSFKIGKAFGIPLYLHATFLLLPLYTLFFGRHPDLVSLLFQEVVLLSIFACVLLHELGHALMARKFGIGTRDITLYPIGGVARLDSTGNQPHEELCIALAGPAVNLVIGVLLVPLVLLADIAGLLPTNLGEMIYGGSGDLLSFLASYLVVLCVGNFSLLLFNLAPVFPMDGGRALRALLGMNMSQLRATEFAATIGLFLAGCLALLGVFSGQYMLVFVALFVAFAGQRELAALRRGEAQRRAEEGASAYFNKPLLVEPVRAESAVHAEQTGFTGFVWDRDHHVWVHWVDGRPVQAF